LAWGSEVRRRDRWLWRGLDWGLEVEGLDRARVGIVRLDGSRLGIVRLDGSLFIGV